jgi:hypothetical protein
MILLVLLRSMLKLLTVGVTDLDDKFDVELVDH